MSIIELTDLSVTFDESTKPVRALQKVNLEIDEGDLVAIVGRSGSGKSTLANIIGLLLVPTEGVYRLKGQPVGSLHPSERARFRNDQIGFVFQRYHLLPRLTALQNVQLPLTYKKGGSMSRRQAMARAEHCLDQFGLSHRIHQRPTTLSGGEQQRVAIARAMVNDPAIILADEPTGALDTANGDMIADMLHMMSEQDGRTVMIITHDERLAQRCRHQVHITDGRLARQAA